MKLIAPRTYELDEAELQAYTAIKKGESVTGSHLTDPYALLRLTRNGLIENVGTRRHPNYVPSDNWKMPPFSLITTIILPDGEHNRDQTIAEFDHAIEDLETLLEQIKIRREEYVTGRKQTAERLRVNQSWRKFIVDNQEETADGH